MNTINYNTRSEYNGGPSQEVVNQMLTLAPGTAIDWLRQLCRHYGYCAELTQYRINYAYTKADFADMEYNHAARSRKLLMSETVLLNKTMQINRLVQAHGLAPVLEGVSNDKSEAVARTITYAESLVAQSPCAKFMTGINQVRKGVVNKLIVLEPKTIEGWIRQVCRLYGLVAELEQYWILKASAQFLITNAKYDFEDRIRRLQAEVKAICSSVLTVNYLARRHCLPAVLANVGDDTFEIIAHFLTYVESLVAQSPYTQYLYSEKHAA